MKTTLVISLILLIIFVASCIKPVEVAKVPPAEAEMTEDVTGIDTLQEDLDTSELDTLDKDLAEITW